MAKILRELFRAGKHFKRPWCKKTDEVTVMGALEVPQAWLYRLCSQRQRGQQASWWGVSALMARANASHSTARGVRLLSDGAAGSCGMLDSFLAGWWSRSKLPCYCFVCLKSHT